MTPHSLSRGHSADGAAWWETGSGTVCRYESYAAAEMNLNPVSSVPVSLQWGEQSRNKADVLNT